ncbi:MAG: hypothetical protein D6753_15005 [Planctomycetota bacterium]|nr:MAG: hypothetical protein D6753_15005 [Planctomycetota bacterium]
MLLWGMAIWALEPWSMPFQNLRATRRTELEEIYPSHVIDAWLGHTTAVANRHYLQVTDEHWQRAIESGPLVRDTTGRISNPHESRKPKKIRLRMASAFFR